MPSPIYTQLLATIASFIEREKAIGIIDRQLKAKSLSPETLATKDLAAIMTALATASSLYVPDATRKDVLKSKLKSMVP